MKFPISRDPPEGGTRHLPVHETRWSRFQFLGIPPKGEHDQFYTYILEGLRFPISRDPPEGGTVQRNRAKYEQDTGFPISRDPPEGGTGG